MKLFSVFDNKAVFFQDPFVQRSVAEAIRAFTVACNDPKTSLFLHPNDYVLFEVGEFDERTGVIVPCEPKINHGMAIEFRQEAKIEGQRFSTDELEYLLAKQKEIESLANGEDE